MVLGHAIRDGRYLGEDIATGEVVCHKTRWGQSERWTIVDARNVSTSGDRDSNNLFGSERSYLNFNLRTSGTDAWEKRPIRSCDPIGTTPALFFITHHESLS